MASFLNDLDAFFGGFSAGFNTVKNTAQDFISFVVNLPHLFYQLVLMIPKPLSIILNILMSILIFVLIAKLRKVVK